ncbi:MAG: immune inhibitor A [Candidatus Cloacimonetes bacterium]|nr:immune inhibitor A [Candidatus Cloacimonadota bacterium]
MKKHLILAILMVFVLGVVYADSIMTPHSGVNAFEVASLTGQTANLRGSLRNEQNVLREETVFYMQDFESGWNGWYSVDGTLPAAMWHLTDWNAYGGVGYSWWMGDPEIGGYRNLQYLALDTPEIAVTAGNSTLTFKLNYNMEPPETYQQYDGWDGANIRISTDGGNTWTVINGTPAYNCTSMYSFGVSHGEGVGVPGWGGSSDGWVDASFDLSSYVGQNVRIRFAFASDPAADTTENPSWFGIMVDNIALGAFDHDFNDNQTHGMVASSVVPVGGDLWHIGTPTPLPPSPPHAAVCQNDQGSYDGLMMNYLVSEPITLPSSGDIRVDFMVRGAVDGDTNLFPNCDYWGWEISPDAGFSWYAMSNPYNIPGDPNYVYIDVPDMWTSMISAYSLDGYISEYAGQTVQFRIFLRSIDHTPVGEGLMIDNYTIYHSEYLPVPINLTAEAEGQEVNLSWSPPGAGGSEGWIHWDDGINFDGIGLTADGTFDVAAFFSRQDMEPYVGGYITTVKIFPRSSVATTSYELYIWKGVSGNEVVYNQALTGLTFNQWNELTLTEPVYLEFGQDYWVGYNVEHVAGEFPAGCDSGPHVPGKGDMIRMGAGGWQSLYTASGGAIDANWNIQALVEILDIRTGEPVVKHLQREEITGYNVYHSLSSGAGYTSIGTTDATETNFVHQNPEEGAVNYYVVTALYGTSESGYSNVASAFVIPATSEELAYDDGTAESGYNVGNNSHLAVKFMPNIINEVQLTHLKIYVETVRTAPMVIKVWEDEDGFPGEFAIAQFVFPANQIQLGWNIIPIPEGTPIYLEDGYFFVGILESANSSAIGVDEDSVGNSYIKITTNPWSQFQNGNFMIRAILAGYSDVDEILIPSNDVLTVTNYPNPFNPETIIKMNLPHASHVKLSVYNVKGQLVKVLVDDYLNAGTHQTVWNGTDNRGINVSSGLYFYSLESDGQIINRRMMLLK